jgi:hypothetical protein
MSHLKDPQDLQDQPDLKAHRDCPEKQPGEAVYR